MRDVPASPPSTTVRTGTAPRAAGLDEARIWTGHGILAPKRVEPAVEGNPEPARGNGRALLGIPVQVPGRHSDEDPRRSSDHFPC